MLPSQAYHHLSRHRKLEVRPTPPFLHRYVLNIRTVRLRKESAYPLPPTSTSTISHDILPQQRADLFPALRRHLLQQLQHLVGSPYKQRQPLPQVGFLVESPVVVVIPVHLPDEIQELPHHSRDQIAEILRYLFRRILKPHDCCAREQFHLAADGSVSPGEGFGVLVDGLAVLSMEPTLQERVGGSVDREHQRAALRVDD